MSALLDAVRRLAAAAKDYNPTYAAARQASEVLLDKTFAGRAEAIVEALEAPGKERQAAKDQRTCIQQVQGDSHIQCGTCSLCLERKVLRDLAEALEVKDA